MNEKLKTRLDRAKKYAIDKAPEIVTAACAVTMTTVGLVVLKRHSNNVDLLKKGIDLLKEEGRDFTYYPGLGLYIEKVVEVVGDTAKEAVEAAAKE